jgi:MFS family permease
MFHRLAARRHVTLGLCTLLHLFTHAYGTILVPLYLLIVADLKLGGVNRASLIVTLYGGFYCLGSFPAGVLADRFDRKLLLGIGLLGNAVAITLMGLTRNYEMLMALGILAGLFGTLFHPAANALVPAHYPKNPGMAIGLLGMGSGLGFFVGPQFAGWRAHAAHWHVALFPHVADWQRPCVELGLAGIIGGVIFLLIAREVHGKETGRDESHPPLGKVLAGRVMALSVVLGCRDFAGVATLSLAGIFLQKAHHLSVTSTGMILGFIMLSSVLVNPVVVYLSPGRRRLPALIVALVLGGVVIPLAPFFSCTVGILLIGFFQTCQMGSYAISDAAMLERVSNAVRGRVVGLFLTIAGTFGATGPWIMGAWTDFLKARAAIPSAYLGPFLTMGIMMIVASFSIPFIARLGPAGASVVEPFTETSPATLEPVG